MKLQFILLVFIAFVSSSVLVATPLSKQHVVEVYFVADYKSLTPYLREENNDVARAMDSMERDIDYFITEVNKLYRSLQTANVVISKRKLTLLEKNIFRSSDVYGGDMVNTQVALNTFDTWLKQQGALSTLNYDLALLWTGFDLASTSRSSAGYAWVGTVCAGEKATSVVEFDGTYSTVVNTAHEIGHNLGASHDSGSTGFIMAPSASPKSTNRWDFSLCSSSDIAGVLGKLKENCLLSTNPTSSVPASSITKNLNSPNALCMRKKGPDSYLCHSQNLYNDSTPDGDAMCRSLWCYTGSLCESVISSDGLTCGVNKVCFEGTCQFDTIAGNANVDPKCLYGDQKKVNIRTNRLTNIPRTCAQFLDATSNRMCDQSWINDMCCKTCKERKGDPSCPWGDQSKQCAEFRPYQICGDPNNSKICCQLCKGYQPTFRIKRAADGPMIMADPLPSTLDNSGDNVMAPADEIALMKEHVPYALD